MKIIAVILFLAGVAEIVFGFFNIFSKRLDNWFKRNIPDSSLDKELLTPKDRNLISRYVVGVRIVFYGGILVVISVFIYMFY